MRDAGGGSIVHLSSIYGREAGGRPGYNAMKAALISHAKAMAIELAPDNIRVNTVAPGSIASPGGTWWKRQQEDPEGMARFVQGKHPDGPLRNRRGGRQRHRLPLLAAGLLGYRARRSLSTAGRAARTSDAQSPFASPFAD